MTITLNLNSKDFPATASAWQRHKVITSVGTEIFKGAWLVFFIVALVKSGGLIIWDDYGDSTCGKAIDSCLAHIDFIKNAVRTHWQLWARVK